MPTAGPPNPSPSRVEWFRVSFDDEGVTLDVEPPTRDPWRQSFAWTSVVRVCFKPGDWASDGIYVFIRERPESYAIPVDAVGGAELLDDAARDALARFEADQAEKGHGSLIDIGVARFSLRLSDIAFLRAADWRHSTEEGLAATDEREYAPYRPFLKSPLG